MKSTYLNFCQGSKVSVLEAKVKESETALEKVSREAEQLRSEVSNVEGRERECRVRCEQLQNQVKSLTNENDSLHAKHLREVSQHLECCSAGFTCVFVCLCAGGEPADVAHVTAYLARRAGRIAPSATSAGGEAGESTTGGALSLQVSPFSNVL